MPTYDYACKGCGHRFEAFQSMKDPVLTTCPECHDESLLRMIGAGAGLLFKGSGFYLTDYKKTGSTPASNGSNNKDGGASSSESNSPKTTDAKADTASTSSGSSGGSSSSNATD